MKVVINKCYGGFGLSARAVAMLRECGALNPEEYSGHIDRTNPDLIRVVETLGHLANDEFAKLKVVTIPDGISWYIHDYDGMESIHESHESWS